MQPLANLIRNSHQLLDYYKVFVGAECWEFGPTYDQQGYVQFHSPHRRNAERQRHLIDIVMYHGLI